MKFSIAFKFQAQHGKIFNYLVDNNLTVKDLAKLIGISSTTLTYILHFQWRPNIHYTKKTEEKLESFFHCSIEQLIPKKLTEAIDRNKELRNLLQRRQIVQKEIDLKYLPFYKLPQLSYTENYDENLDAQTLKKVIKMAMGALSPREEYVLRSRVGFDDDKEKTFEEIGRTLDISGTRAQQIWWKGICKLRDSKRFKEIMKEGWDIEERWCAFEEGWWNNEQEPENPSTI